MSAPWKWRPSSADRESSRYRMRLEDADGGELVAAHDDEELTVESPYVAELIALAPEMAAALRSVEWYGEQKGPGAAVGDGIDSCPSCGARRGDHVPGCKVGTIIARLDAAKKAGG